jgi:hypothetical protein
MDLALLWYPANFGSPEFEFATISRFADGMPVMSMGVGLLVLVGAGSGWRGTAWVGFALAALLVVVLTVLGIVFLTDVPIALKAVLEPVVRTGVKKAIVKTVFEIGVYWLLFGYLAMRSFRAARGR